MNNTYFLQLVVNRCFPIKEISELIISFELIERKKKIQKIIMGFIHNDQNYISRKHEINYKYLMDEYWMIDFSNQSITFCSSNCKICGNYKICSFNSKKSQTEIEKYVYSKLNIEFQNGIFHHALFDYKIYYIYNNVINLKIKCNCNIEQDIYQEDNEFQYNF
jgi:hypothetical protein